VHQVMQLMSGNVSGEEPKCDATCDMEEQHEAVPGSWTLEQCAPV